MLNRGDKSITMILFCQILDVKSYIDILRLIMTCRGLRFGHFDRPYRYIGMSNRSNVVNRRVRLAHDRNCKSGASTMLSSVATTAKSQGKPHGGGLTRKSGGKLVHEGSDGESLESALLTVSDVAVILICSSRTVRRLADAGMMPVPLRLNSLLRWRRADIDEWIAAGCRSCRPSRRAGK